MSDVTLRRGVLGLPDVIAQSVTVIAPAMSGAFLTYLAATKAGGATPLAFLAATAGALFIGGVVAEFAKHLPSAGSLYTYATVGLSRTGGFVLGWAYAIAFLVLGGAVLAGFGYFASTLVQSLTDSATPVPWYWFFLGGLVVIAGLSLFGVQVSTRSQLVFTTLSVLAMVVTAIAVIGNGTPAASVLDPSVPLSGEGRILDLGVLWPDAAGVPWSGIAFGFAFGLLSFTGFEAGAVLAEETASPRRNIPRAILGSVLVGGVFYLLVTYATAIGFGVRQAATDWPGSVAGLAVVAPNQALGDLVLAAAAVSSLFCALGVHTSVTRILYAMSRESVLPAPLSRVHPRYQVPWTAALSILVFWVVLVFGLLLVTSKGTQNAVSALTGVQAGGVFAFSYLATLGTPLVMAAYALVGAAGLRYGGRVGSGRLRAAGGLAALSGLLAFGGSLYYSFKEVAPGAGIAFVIRLVPWLVLAILVLGVALAGWLRGSRPAAWADMGAVFDDTVEPDALPVGLAEKAPFPEHRSGAGRDVERL
jgi:amino acid transporter